MKPVEIPEGFRTIVKGRATTHTERDQFLTLQSSYSVLSKALFEALGSPTHVLLAINDLGELAVIPTDNASGYKVTTTRMVSVGFSRLGAPFAKGRYEAEIREDVAYMSASKPATNETYRPFLGRRAA